MRRTRLILPLIILGISAAVQAVAEMPFNGKSGLSLRNSLYVNFRPSRQWSFGEYSGTMTDPFSGRSVTVAAGELPAGYQRGTIVQDDWWEYAPEIRTQVAADFYNFLPMNPDVVAYRKDLTPGEVTEPVFYNGIWEAGRGLIFGTLTDLYSPPESFLGELARSFFYIAVMYPSTIWTPRGFMMMDANTYPVFNVYATALLMAWHKSYPVTDAERQKNGMGEKLQGNRNPFVDFPDLPDYLWGDKAGENFVVDGEPVQLRGRYRLSDERIDLISTHVPADAVWCVDGIQAQSSKYAPSDLGRGEHNLTYRSPSTGEQGFLKIVIE